MNILDLLDKRGIEYKLNIADNASITCPNAANHEGGFDANPSFNISLSGRGSNCLSCGFKLSPTGTLKWLLGEELDSGQMRCLELRGRLKRIEEQNTSFDFLPLPASSDIVLPPMDRMWTEDYRGISAETYLKFKSYYCSRGRFSNRLVIPLQFNSRLVGFETRALGDEKPKYLRNTGFDAKRIPWPLDYVRDTPDKQYVILTEGIFDCLRLIDLGFPALCNWGVTSFSMDKLIQILSLGVPELILCFDHDDAGRNGEQSVIDLARNWINISVGYKEHFELDPKLSEEKGRRMFRDCGDLDLEGARVMIEKRRKVK